MKCHARQYSVGTKEGFKAKANEAMAMSPETRDLALMRRYSRTDWRWVDAHSRGLGGVWASYAARKPKSHRCAMDAVDLEVNRLADERKAGAEARASTGQAPVGLSLLGPVPRHLLKWQLRVPRVMPTKSRMNTASKLGPHTQTDRGTCPDVGL